MRVASLLRELARDWAITLIAPGGIAPGGIERPVAVDWIPVALTGAGLSYPWRFDARALLAARDSAGAFDAALIWPGAEAVGFGMPAVMDMIDCNALEFWREMRGARGRARLRAARQLVSATWWGRRTVRGYAATACVGEADAAWLRRMGPAGRVHVVPNGVDVPEVVAAESTLPVVSFTGTLDFPPNVEAVLWAARDVWPLVRAAVPEAMLVVAGRRPVADIRALEGRDGISVRGDVADMSAVLGESWISVAPMRGGVGIKNKVLEAWACGRPVVMTALATNGLALPAGHAGLVQGDAAGMAGAVVGLLRDGTKRRALGAAARAHVVGRYRWRHAADAIDALLRGAA